TFAELNGIAVIHDQFMIGQCAQFYIVDHPGVVASPLIAEAEPCCRGPSDPTAKVDRVQLWVCGGIVAADVVDLGGAPSGAICASLHVAITLEFAIVLFELEDYVRVGAEVVRIGGADPSILGSATEQVGIEQGKAIGRSGGSDGIDGKTARGRRGADDPVIVIGVIDVANVPIASIGEITAPDDIAVCRPNRHLGTGRLSSRSVLQEVGNLLSALR